MAETTKNPTAGRPVAEFNDDAESRVAPNVVSILTKSTFDQCSSSGSLVASSQRKIRNSPRRHRVSKASEDAGFMRKISRGQFMTLDDMELTGFGYAGSCREHASPQDDERSTLIGWVRGDTKIGPILEVKGGVCITCINMELKSKLPP